MMDYVFRSYDAASVANETSDPDAGRDCSRMSSYIATIIGGSLAGYHDISSKLGLRDAVGNVGPLSAALEAGQSSFQFCCGGVPTAHCGARFDHGALVVS